MVDRYAPTSNQTHVPVWLKGPPRRLAREKAARWEEYMEARREFGRNHELAAVAFDAFYQVNYRYRNFVRNKQYIYECSMVERLVAAPKLFLSYVRRKKKGCPSVGPLKSSYGRVVCV